MTTHKEIGRLTLISQTRKRANDGAIIWIFGCQCGKLVLAPLNRVKHGTVRSCGCLREWLRRTQCKTHGKSRTPMYTLWQGMLNRCRNPKITNYERYGGRGIAVCDLWLNFENFVADMGERPSRKHSLDRSDNDGNYEPGNVRWSTAKQQAQNRRPVSVEVKRKAMAVAWNTRRRERMAL